MEEVRERQSYESGRERQYVGIMRSMEEGG